MQVYYGWWWYIYAILWWIIGEVTSALRGLLHLAHSSMECDLFETIRKSFLAAQTASAFAPEKYCIIPSCQKRFRLMLLSFTVTAINKSAAQSAPKLQMAGDTLLFQGNGSLGFSCSTIYWDWYGGNEAGRPRSVDSSWSIGSLSPLSQFSRCTDSITTSADRCTSYLFRIFEMEIFPHGVLAELFPYNACKIVLNALTQPLCKYPWNDEQGS